MSVACSSLPFPTDRAADPARRDESDGRDRHDDAMRCDAMHETSSPSRNGVTPLQTIAVDPHCLMFTRIHGNRCRKYLSLSLSPALPYLPYVLPPCCVSSNGGWMTGGLTSVGRFVFFSQKKSRAGSEPGCQRPCQKKEPLITNFGHRCCFSCPSRSSLRSGQWHHRAGSSNLQQAPGGSLVSPYDVLLLLVLLVSAEVSTDWLVSP